MFIHVGTDGEGVKNDVCVLYLYTHTYTKCGTFKIGGCQKGGLPGDHLKPLVMFHANFYVMHKKKD